jgi:hypothetical protein
LSPVAKVRMSDEARDRWRAFAKSQGVTMTAFLEACANALPDPDDERDPRMVAVLEEARAIMVERNSRD